jgi:hypothetical protein
MQPEQLRALAASKEQLQALVERGEFTDAMTSQTEAGYDLLMLLLFYPENFTWFLTQTKVQTYLKSITQPLLKNVEGRNALLLALDKDVIALYTGQIVPFENLVSVLHSATLFESVPYINNYEKCNYIIKWIIEHNITNFKELITDSALLEAALPKSSLLVVAISGHLTAAQFLIHMENLKKNKTLDACVNNLNQNELETLQRILDRTGVVHGDEFLKKISIETLSFKFKKLLPFLQPHFINHPQEWEKFLKTLDRNRIIYTLKSMSLREYHYEWQVRAMYLLILLYKEFDLLGHAASLKHAELYHWKNGHGERGTYVVAKKSFMQLVALESPQYLLECIRGINKTIIKNTLEEVYIAYSGLTPESWMEILGYVEMCARMAPNGNVWNRNESQMKWRVIKYIAHIHHYLMSIDYKKSDLAKGWHSVSYGINAGSIAPDQINENLKNIRNMGGLTRLSGPMHDNINALRRLEAEQKDPVYDACLKWGFDQYAAFLNSIKNARALGYDADADFAEYLLQEPVVENKNNPKLPVENSNGYTWFGRGALGTATTAASTSSMVPLELQPVDTSTARIPSLSSSSD